jgi:predicted anti-sigma-YlaC factor YlaD
MPEMCNINKNLLLDLYFHETSGKEKQKIRKHVEQCSECREYLMTLEQTNQSLHQWQDQSPLPDTLDIILEKIPDPEPKPVKAKPALAAAPFIKIAFSILAVLLILVFLHNQVTQFSFWETLQEWWFVKLFGSLGVTAVLFFLLGTFITLALSPVLILESKSRKYKYYFS